jgi:hypothetical protein
VKKSASVSTKGKIDAPSLGFLRVQRYNIRACFHGTLHWTCPWCANHNSSSIMPDYYLIDCSGSRRISHDRYPPDYVDRAKAGKFVHAPVSCDAHFIPSVQFRPAPIGFVRRPADWRIPEGNQLVDSMPLGEINREAWRWGERAHSLYGAERVKELDAVRRFILRAEAAGVGRLESTRIYLENEVAIEERGASE